MTPNPDRSNLEHQIDLLKKHSDLIVRLFNEQELFVHSSESEWIDAIRELAQARMVRVEVEPNFRRIRLTRATLEFCRLSSERARIEKMQLGIEEAFEAVDIHLEAWLRAENEGHYQDAMESQDLIEVQINDLEYTMAEKIDNVDRDIDMRYGFDERSDTHISRFRHYRNRLSWIQEEARTLREYLNYDQYRQYGFFDAFANRIISRIQRHSTAMSHLDDKLGRHIALLERRLNRTRKSIVFRRWLAKQNKPLQFSMAESRADEYTLMYRAEPLTIDGFPDLDNPHMREFCKPIAREVIKRSRKTSASSQHKERPESGQAVDTAILINEIEDEEAENDTFTWDEDHWMRDFVERAIDDGLAHETHQASATNYWQSCLDASEGMAIHIPNGFPSARAWLNEVVTMVVNNRYFDGRLEGKPLFDAFYADFVYEADDKAADVRQSPLRATDVQLQLRPAMRQRLQSNQTAEST